MVNVESHAPVIDLEMLLQPISEENPSGESLQYSGLYDEIREARRADDAFTPQGEWQYQLKTADYRKVIDLAVPALTSQTKDLQIAAWLAESLTREYGFVGLRDSLKLMSGLLANFWETCFPEVDEGDQEGRANAIEWMDRQTTIAMRETPITAGEGLSYNAYDESKRFDIPENLDDYSSDEQEKFAELRAEAERFNRVTGERWRRAKSATRRAFYEEISLALEECQEAFQELDRTIEEKFDRNQMPGLGGLKKSLEDVGSLVKRLLQEKREEEPDETVVESSEETGAENAASENENGNGTGAFAVGGGALRTRQEALKRLSEVAEFFRKTEPHSPVSYLVQRAVKWGNMPLDSWLQEVIKDENVLGQLKETLGIGGYADSGYNGDESSSESSDW